MPRSLAVAIRYQGSWRLRARLGAIVLGSKVSIDLVRGACLLQRKSSLSTAYRQPWNQLREQLSEKFQCVVAAVVDAMKHIPRASSMVENFNSRLRTYFTLRRQLGTPYLVWVCCSSS